MKKVIKIFRIILIVIVLLVVSLFALSRIFEKKIVAEAVEIINAKISVPISVDNVQLNLFRSFPQLTINLQNVIIESPSVFNNKAFVELDKTHLADLQNVYLSFNLKSILDNSFEINKIQLSGGTINILVNSTGVDNYQIFRENKKEKEKTDLDLSLSGIQLKNVDVNYINRYKSLGVYFHTNNYLAKGRFLNDDFTVTTKGEVKLNKYMSHNFSFIPKNPTNIRADIVVEKDKVKINSALLTTMGIQFNSIGLITLSDPIQVDISLSGNEISISSLLEILPADIKFLKDVDATGMLEINTRVLGQVSGKISPRIKTVFSISEGSLNQNSTDIEIRSLKLEGEFNNYNEPNLSVKDFSFKSDSSSFHGNLQLSSLKDPVLSLETSFNLLANELHELFLKEKVDSLSGSITGKIKAKGKISDKISLDALTQMEHEGSIKVKDFNLFMQDDNIKIESASGNLQLINNKLNFSSVKGEVQNTKVICEGDIVNVFGVFNESDAPVVIKGKLNADNLNYANIEKWFISNNESTAHSTMYNINAELSIKHFQYNNFECSDIAGATSYVNEKLEAKALKFNAFGGQIETYLSFETINDNTKILQMLTNTNSIEINEFFTAFNNFNQTFITDKNILGKVTSSFEAEISIVNNIYIANSLDLLGHIRITDGKLIDFEPAQQLSSFSDIDDLKELSFSTIENDILINNGKIFIPKMEIETSVMDISIFGEQELAGDYEYHIKLLLSDMLHKKSKAVRERQSEFGEIEDDGLGETSIYVVATGANGETSIKFDRKEMRANLSSDMKEEKKEIKKVLNKEFGWFKKDSSIKEEKVQPKFEIEWEEE